MYYFQHTYNLHISSYSSLFIPIPSYSYLFLPIPSYSFQFLPITSYSFLFLPIPSYSYSFSFLFSYHECHPCRCQSCNAGEGECGEDQPRGEICPPSLLGGPLSERECQLISTQPSMNAAVLRPSLGGGGHGNITH